MRIDFVMSPYVRVSGSVLFGGAPAGTNLRLCRCGRRRDSLQRVLLLRRAVRTLFRRCFAARAGEVKRQLADPWILPSQAR